MQGDTDDVPPIPPPAFPCLNTLVNWLSHSASAQMMPCFLAPPSCLPPFLLVWTSLFVPLLPSFPPPFCPCVTWLSCSTPSHLMAPILLLPSLCCCLLYPAPSFPRFLPLLPLCHLAQLQRLFPHDATLPRPPLLPFSRPCLSPSSPHFPLMSPGSAAVPPHTAVQRTEPPDALLPHPPITSLPFPPCVTWLSCSASSHSSR